MNFWEVMRNISIFFQDNLIITIPLACILLFLLFRKLKLFLIILFIVLLLIGILYIISDVTTTGIFHKQKLIQ